MSLERLGVPTVTICTESFVDMAREEARNLGMPELRLAIIQHPLGGEPDEEVARRSHDAMDQLVDGLTREA